MDANEGIMEFVRGEDDGVAVYRCRECGRETLNSDRVMVYEFCPFCGETRPKITDLERIKGMLKRVKITWSEEPCKGGVSMEIERGYVGFYVGLRFSKEGLLLDVESYEG